MSSLVDLIFKPDAAKQQGPSAQEKAAQAKQKKILDAQQRRESSEGSARNKILASRAGGAQTLFTSPGSVPKARSLGGGETA